MAKSVYKIRNKTSGLFSTGGSSPGFTKVGKTWSTIGYLKSHLTMWADMGYHQPPRPFPDNWEIVEMIVTENVLTYEEMLAK